MGRKVYDINLENENLSFKIGPAAEYLKDIACNYDNKYKNVQGVIYDDSNVDNTINIQIEDVFNKLDAFGEIYNLMPDCGLIDYDGTDVQGNEIHLKDATLTEVVKAIAKKYR